MTARLISGVLVLVAGWVAIGAATSPLLPWWMRVAAVVMALCIIVTDARIVVVARERVERRADRLHRQWVRARRMQPRPHLESRAQPTDPGGSGEPC